VALEVAAEAFMATLRRIQAVTVRYNASHWLSVILGAYFSLQLVTPGMLG
jgi:hypothetical protein